MKYETDIDYGEKPIIWYSLITIYFMTIMKSIMFK